MSAGYQAVGWNRQKRRYDLVIALGVATFLAVFLLLGAATHPEATIETLLIRALGTAGFLLLHVVLSIGPLARLDPRFLPLLYNRRHLGVSMFLLALAHGMFSLVQFHALGDTNPLTSTLVSNTRYDSVSQFPFQPLGFVALLILYMMASTSHDFWLANLTAPVWKALHMSVYGAYALLVAHVALGVLQAETNPLFALILACGMLSVLGLHVVAAIREGRGDRALDAARTSNGYVDACSVDEIQEGGAYTVCVSGERVAIFRHDNRISAVSNVCQHQNGPLGEGRILDGCITCPWHGYQYLPDTGASPPPFTERVPTFRAKVEQGRVYIHPLPNAPGTRVEPRPVRPLAAEGDHV